MWADVRGHLTSDTAAVPKAVAAGPEAEGGCWLVFARVGLGMGALQVGLDGTTRLGFAS